MVDEHFQIILERFDRRHEHAQSVRRAPRPSARCVPRMRGDGAALAPACTPPRRDRRLRREMPRERQRCSRGPAAASRSANGSAGTRCGYSAARHAGSDCSGSRKPSGESPGIRNNRAAPHAPHFAQPSRFRLRASSAASAARSRPARRGRASNKRENARALAGSSIFGSSGSMLSGIWPCLSIR